MNPRIPRIPVADAPQVRAALRQDVRSDRRAFAATLALNALAAIAALVGPAYLGRIVDAVTSAHPSVSAVDRDALVIVVFALAQILLSRWALLVGARFGERTSARIRERMLERALALPASVAEHATTGDLVSRGTSDAGMVATTLRDAAPIIFVSAVQVLCIAGAVLVLNPLLGISAVLCLAGDVFVLRWYLRRSRPAFLAQSLAGAAITDVLESTASGARTVEALGLQRRRIEAAETAFAASIKAQLRSLRLRLVLFPTVDASYVLPLAGILLIGGVLYEHGEISLGAVVASTVYMRQLVGPLDTMLLWVQMLQNAAVSYARVEGLAAAPQEQAPTGEIPQGDHIEVADVRFAYNADHGDVLHGVNLVVQPGERLAIVGASGAGKSTLGRLLAGIDRPSHGSVTVGGIPIADLPPERLRRQVVLVTQEHHVFDDTLRGNLTLAKAGATADEVLAALAAVDAGWVDALPEGLNTTVAGNGHRLDGAQAQQLALARVVLADPHTVILDEATALLDPATARNTERALAAVLKGRTVIAIAHRLQTAHDADRIAVMDAGSVTELGTHEELVALNGTYAALWHSWHGG
ncbi:ATP-binding cassette subfamily C protein [Kitasatospora sp. MAP12-15]|uniref:ABC transporter ATP-binding protein n=1 Tax=unclassified Kitasatospora TaxID=2633591 RepID=UPI0024758FBC|nr:ABC transporter ATP-binding protein [Kitasatospora sp. MAP12-44]MDH6113677.1 ATP-binding cassette subfamily C protein [Kitasatospora sp. MAP12-44]